ncbi:unnamed protein product [Mycena citricolor]|uniref:N-acetyltransferase domain-containing protein n=1 Tax=Mycena citricolor TaxID=2018698 RepID=A0AAD2JUH5_9AGAR|nr:unnamed protein product [Mycena citricolor]CAK5262773.1 unnamed protein product [Mycena citricolor]
MAPIIVSTELIHSKGRAVEGVIEECHRLRKEVFHLEQVPLSVHSAYAAPHPLPQGFPLDTEFDEVEDLATHFLLRVTEEDPDTSIRTVKSVGTIRGTTPEIYPAINRYKLSRLVVDKDYRKHRFGRVLVEELHRWVQDDAKATQRPAVIECHSQIPAMGFYAKFGYIPEASRFHEGIHP